MRDDTARNKTTTATVVDPDKDELVGQTLNGRFEVVAPIARGGMGKVYRAVQLPLGRQVALKVLDVRGVLASRTDFQRRFFLEAATAAKLNHPNTIVVFDYGLAGNDVFFIAMELVEGRTLAQTFKSLGPLEPLRVIHIGKQICGSLGEAHSHGVVHRDLKPSNVLLARRGSDNDFVKVLDFGLVKVLGDEESGTELTQSGVMMGTPRYMSPEQVTGRDVTGQSDIYALGAVLYHALAGRPPFDGESKFEIFSAHVSLAPVPLREAYPLYAAPARLEALVMRCLAKEPRARFGTMEEVERELIQCERDIRANPLAYATGSAATTMERALPKLESMAPEPLASAPTRVVPPPMSPVSNVIVAPPSGSYPHPSGPQLQTGDVSGSGVSMSGTGMVFQLPREPSSPARSGMAGFLGVMVALALIALGATGYYAFTRTTVVAPPAHMPGEPPPLVNTPTAAPTGPAPVVVTPRVVCNVPGARVSRAGVDLGDCGAALPVPTGGSWDIDVTAPGYVSRHITIFSGQGDVSISLTRRSGGSSGRLGDGASGGRSGGSATPPARRGGDMRDPWN